LDYQNNYVLKLIDRISKLFAALPVIFERNYFEGFNKIIFRFS